MAKIQLSIEGQDAAAATRALVQIADIKADWQPVGDNQKELTLAAIATIVGITGGTLGIAEQIRKWYREWKKAPAAKKIEKVVLIGPDRRILLENASVEDIKSILDQMA